MVFLFFGDLLVPCFASLVTVARGAGVTLSRSLSRLIPGLVAPGPWPVGKANGFMQSGMARVERIKRRSFVKSEYGDKSGKAAKIDMTASCVAEPRGRVQKRLAWWFGTAVPSSGTTSRPPLLWGSTGIREPGSSSSRSCYAGLPELPAAEGRRHRE